MRVSTAKVISNKCNTNNIQHPKERNTHVSKANLHTIIPNDIQFQFQILHKTSAIINELRFQNLESQFSVSEFVQFNSAHSSVIIHCLLHQLVQALSGDIPLSWKSKHTQLCLCHLPAHSYNFLEQ